MILYILKRCVIFMILSDKEIREHVTKENLIENFKEERLQSASYDISASYKIQRFINHAARISLISKDSVDSICEEVDIRYGYDLKPNEYILIQINEKINMPNNLVAHVRPRTTLIKLGLILSLQHLNPAFKGYLQLGLYNASPYTIEILPNLVIGQIVFEEIVSIPTEEKWYSNKVDAKYQNEEKFIGSKVYDDFDDKVDKTYKAMISALTGRIGD